MLQGHLAANIASIKMLCRAGRMTNLALQRCANNVFSLFDIAAAAISRLHSPSYSEGAVQTPSLVSRHELQPCGCTIVRLRLKRQSKGQHLNNLGPSVHVHHYKRDILVNNSGRLHTKTPAHDHHTKKHCESNIQSVHKQRREEIQNPFMFMDQDIVCVKSDSLSRIASKNG